MSKEYLVRLKPLDAYFFSGRETFNYSNGESKEKGSYFVKSKKFPQQTTLLGVIRKQILIEEEEYKENRDYSKNYKRVIELIGNGSFNIEKPNDGFGKIKSLSPVFLYKDENIFTPAPLDYRLKFKKEDSGKSYFNAETDYEKYNDFIPLLKGYETKSGLNKKIVGFNPYDNPYSFNDIFKEDERVGIDVKSDKDGYYRQLNYKLKNDFEFCFFINLEEDIFNIDKTPYIETVYVGGEGRPFKLVIEESQKRNLIEEFEIKKNRIVCISDVVLKEKEYQFLKTKSDFILGETEFFKNYVFKEGKEKTSKPYLLLKRGSVIYFKKNESEIRKKIKNEYVEMIGYNYITGGDE